MRQYVHEYEQTRKAQLAQAHATAVLQRSKRVPPLKKLLSSTSGKARKLGQDEAAVKMRHHLAMQRRMAEIDKRGGKK